jgi:hypothetical protein
MTMPQPPSLSPAAQAVLDAMHRSYDHEPTRRAIAAGVLRAAADRMTGVIPDVCFSAFARGVEAAAAFAEGLATELDPQPTSTNHPANETP